jgi:hypothetical protein
MIEKPSLHYKRSTGRWTTSIALSEEVYVRKTQSQVEDIVRDESESSNEIQKGSQLAQARRRQIALKDVLNFYRMDVDRSDTFRHSAAVFRSYTISILTGYNGSGILKAGGHDPQYFRLIQSSIFQEIKFVVHQGILQKRPKGQTPTLLTLTHGRP